MADNAAIIRDFCAAWSRLDVDEIVDYFTEDGVYHNMPAQPVAGREGLKQFIGGFVANWDKTEWKVLNLLAEGDIVMAERLDCTIAGGKPVDLPCFGIFHMRDGKIAEWRDYFDMATYLKAVS